MHELLSAADARSSAFVRQLGLCARCGEPMRFGDFEAHHRRRRNVLGWCLCNVVALHPRCHTQGPLAVHDHVEQSRDMGLIVSTFGPQPFDVPVWLYDVTDRVEHVRVLLSCDGLTTRLEE